MAYLVARTTLRRRRAVHRLVRQACASAWASQAVTAGDAASRRIRENVIELLRSRLHGRCDQDVVDEAIATAVLRDEVALLHRVDRDLLRLVALERFGLAAAAERVGVSHGQAGERITSGLRGLVHHGPT